MEISTELISALTGIVTSVLGTAIGYGMLKQQVKDLSKEQEGFLHKDVFDATILPMKEDLSRLENDCENRKKCDVV